VSAAVFVIPLGLIVSLLKLSEKVNEPGGMGCASSYCASCTAQARTLHRDVARWPLVLRIKACLCGIDLLIPREYSRAIEKTDSVRLTD